MLADDPDLFVVGDPNQSVYGFNGADPTLLARLPDLLRGTKVIRLDENHRCTPQVVAVATAVLREGGSFSGDSEVVAPRTTRVDGPVPQVIAHTSDDDEAAWAAARAKMSRTPGRRWSSIAVLTRTNAQLTKVKAAMDAALVPSRVAGSDLGPASDLRADADNAENRETTGATGAGRGVDIDPDEFVDDRNKLVEDPANRDEVVLTTFHRAKGLQWPTVMVLGLGAGLMPIASAQTDAAVDEERRLLYVALTRSEDELWCSWFGRVGDDQTAPTRGPSPWLAPIERTVAQLEKEAAPTAASEVAARVAELRQRLVDGTEGADTTR
jgi:DNA helicase-2/ATP-dependent DNA helicase PcrA